MDCRVAAGEIAAVFDFEGAIRRADRLSALGGDALGRDFSRRGAAGFCVRTGNPTRAALAFFLACLAALRLAFANFRARLNAVLAARIWSFALSARAPAFCASASRRFAAAACFARFSDEGVVATVRSRSRKNLGGELSPGAPGLSPGRSWALPRLRYGRTRNKKSRISAISAAQTACAIG
jgi:hypothetical protein